MSKSKSTLCRHECSRSLCQKLGIQVAFIETEEKWNCWEPPEASRVKLNGDGALNHQGAGHGGLIRDRNGVVLDAFSRSGGRQSVVVQELRAIEIGESNKPADYLADLCLSLCNQLVYAGPPIDRELVKPIEEDAVGIKINLKDIEVKKSSAYAIAIAHWHHPKVGTLERCLANDLLPLD
ncbi:hypothetical protein IFM89_022906 [Coptis chinensis]|uniref:RNase H type-1 domain-containing protein n=1 Tax=Coptis chinensis TaxID=261450 RepID=A0A835IRW5_9MAGN|nr:hypothetical protein IFM89_022906 [Coptis chinensis]